MFISNVIYLFWVEVFLVIIFLINGNKYFDISFINCKFFMIGVLGI